MEIVGPITVEEFQEANLLPSPRFPSAAAGSRWSQIPPASNWRWILVGLAGGLLLVGILLDPAIVADPKWSLPLLLILVLGYRFLFSSSALRKAYLRRIQRLPSVLSVDSDGIRFQDRNRIFQFHPWSDYQSWREGSNIFVVHGPHKLSNIVPKRGLDPQQIDELRVLLAMHMPGSA